MREDILLSDKQLARRVGGSILATIVLGISTAIFVTQGIDINLSADVLETAQNMQDAESRLRAKAYLALLTFSLDIIVVIGLFYLLRAYGRLVAGWSVVVGIVGAIIVLMGAVFSLNAAEIVGDDAYQTLADDSLRLLLSGLQATSDYTSFHLGLVTSTAAKAGFFFLFLRSRLLPTLISGWGLFASLFVVSAIIGRDFIPALASNTVTMVFMASNMLAIVSTSLYLCIFGVRENR